MRDGRLAMFESTAPGHEIMISLLDSGAIYSTLGDAPPASVTALEDSAVSPLSGRAIEGLIAPGSVHRGMISDPSSPIAGMMEVEDGTVSGTLEFDVDRGRMLSSRLDTTIRMSVSCLRQ